MEVCKVCQSGFLHALSGCAGHVGLRTFKGVQVGKPASPFTIVLRLRDNDVEVALSGVSLTETKTDKLNVKCHENEIF